VSLKLFHDSHKDIQESLRKYLRWIQLSKNPDLNDFNYFNGMQIKPPYLKRGDLVGISAPARWVTREDMGFFLDVLEKYGYKAILGNVFTRHNQFAGNDLDRLAGLQSMLDHPEIRAVFCARGGYGSIRILKDLNLNAFAENPKWLVGFSDITALHSLLMVRLECESLHGVMPYSLKDLSGPDNPGISSLFDVLRGEMPDYRVGSHDLNRPGIAEGVLAGGNLSVLSSLTGTPFQLPAKNTILFLEDVDEYLYHIDRMVQHLKLAGMLSGLKGLVVGGMTDMHDNEIPFGLDAYKIIQEAVKEFNYPVLFDFPAGHRNPNLALVLGRRSRLVVDDNGGRLVTLDN
jgi:muramoyltetrapeptide carboxypeptidase